MAKNAATLTFKSIFPLYLPEKYTFVSVSVALCLLEGQKVFKPEIWTVVRTFVLFLYNCTANINGPAKYKYRLYDYMCFFFIKTRKTNHKSEEVEKSSINTDKQHRQREGQRGKRKKVFNNSLKTVIMKYVL